MGKRVATLVLLSGFAACSGRGTLGGNSVDGSGGGTAGTGAPAGTSGAGGTEIVIGATDAGAGEIYQRVWGTDDELWILGRSDPPQPTTLHPIASCGPGRWNASMVLKHKTAGGDFVLVDQPATTFVSDLHGSSATDVWMVSFGGQAYQYDGHAWRTHDLRQAEGLAWEDDDCGELSSWAIFARSPNDVWIAGFIYPSKAGPGLILHYDGTGWRRHAVDALDGFFDIWAASASDVWAVGSSGLAYHYDGTSWTNVNAATNMYLFSVLGTTKDDVWAAGNTSVTAHFDGTGWQLMDPGQDDSTTRALAGGPDRGIWALRTTGDTPKKDQWRQAVVRWDGQAWREEVATTDPARELQDLFMTPGGQLWGVGRDVIRLR
jgi:hypothetical protein